MTVLDLHLGIDFGTRYTKVCVRDTSREQSWIIKLGQSDNDLDQALILSQIGITHDGQIIGGLTQYEWKSYSHLCVVKVDYIKMRLAHLDISQDASQWYSPQINGLPDYGLSLEDTLENICAFFLLRIIQRAKQSIVKNNQDLLRNMTIEWGVSVGVPVAYWDSPALTRFEKVLRLAWTLAERETTNYSFQLVSSELMKLKESIISTDIPCCAIPEVAAAISSFTNSRQVKQGTYIFFDVGGGTIEGVSFNLYRDNEDQRKIDFYTALVEPLGVNSIAKKILDHFKEVSESTIETNILFKGDDILNHIQKISSIYVRDKRRSSWHLANKHKAIYELVEENLNYDHATIFFIQQLVLAQRWIHTQVAKVFVQLYNKTQSSTQPFLFLSGGGKLSKYYQDTINSTYEAFMIKHRGIPRYQYLEVPVPEDCSMSEINGIHYHRFSVAYGLSIPDYNYPQIGLPSQFPNLPPQTRVPQWIPEPGLPDK